MITIELNLLGNERFDQAGLALLYDGFGAGALPGINEAQPFRDPRTQRRGGPRRKPSTRLLGILYRRRIFIRI